MRGLLSRLSLARLLINATEYETALSTLDQLLAEQPHLAAAHHLRGRALRLRQRTNEANDAFRDCLAASPRATSCITELADIAANDGRCSDAAELGERLISIEPLAEEGYLQLARALLGRGEGEPAVRAVLDRLVSVQREIDRAGTRGWAAFLLDVNAGRFAAARASLDAWITNSASAQSDRQLATQARMGADLYIENKDRAGAEQAARAYLSRKSAIRHPDHFDRRIVGLSLLYRSDALTAAAFRQERDAWVASERGTIAPLMIWHYGFADPIRTADDAREAITSPAIAAGIPLSHGYRVDFDTAAGHAYLLAGRPRDALPFLEKATRSCHALFLPFDHTRAYLYLGKAHEALGEVAAACSAYSTVLSRWGAMPNAVTTLAAHDSFSHLHCRTILQ